jgi:CheY-like chemotaxis protein
LIEAKEKAEESDRLKMAFLANISHEIRTPMNGIMGFANILKNNELENNDRQKFLDIIEKSGHRMLDTINDLIYIAEIESGQVTLHNNICNVNDILTTLFDFFQPQAHDKNLQLVLMEPVPAHMAIINTDHSKINSVLTNLIKNAIKFTRQGKIEVGCTIVKGMLEFMVRDTGIGIPVPRHEAIFRRFEQADMEEARHYQGSGLGLAIAKAYVQMMGGMIWVESKPGAGSIFRFTIPFLPVNLKKSSATNIHNPLPQENIPDFTGKSILIVEDDLYSREMVSYLLIKAGASILVATDGLDWVQQFATGKVDLVLLDIQLPRLDGFTILKLIRSKDEHVPVVAQTAYALPDDIQRLQSAGFTDYITKPVNPDVLYQTIDRYLNITHFIKHTGR